MIFDWVLVLNKLPHSQYPLIKIRKRIKKKKKKKEKGKTNHYQVSQTPIFSNGYQVFHHFICLSCGPLGGPGSINSSFNSRLLDS
jgi:hypothetical protein